MREATIVATYARAFIDFAVGWGVDRGALVARGGVGSRCLDDDARLPVALYASLLHAGIELSGEPALALFFGECVPTQELSIIAQIVANAGNVENGRREMDRYARLILDEESGSAGQVDVERRNGKLWLKFGTQTYEEHPMIMEAGVARSVCGARSMMAAFGIPLRFPEAIHFRYPEPAHRAEYDRVFGVPLFFGSDVNAIVVDEAFMALVWPQSNGPAMQVIRAHADEQLARLNGAGTMRARVEAHLVKVLGSGDVDVESVASALSVSRATLSRRLRAEGTTFEKVLVGVRHKRALHYLNTEHASVSQTAHLLGFSDPASFSRAFKRWTGTSPRNRR
jgi:AraC-like DNA-binding protein